MRSSFVGHKVGSTLFTGVEPTFTKIAEYSALWAKNIAKVINNYATLLLIHCAAINYKKIYFRITKIDSTYMNQPIFFAFPVQMLRMT